MRRRFRVYSHHSGDVYWYVMDSTLSKSNGQVIALCHSRRDAYRVAAALNAVEGDSQTATNTRNTQ
jgi:replicative superfamily II helicase